MSLAVVWAVALKDLRQFVRDRTLMFFILLLPAMQLLLLAQATGRGINDVPLGVLDYDRSSESRAFLTLLEASERFTLVLYPDTWEEGLRALESGKIYALLAIPKGMASALYNPTERAQLNMVTDATSSIMANIVEGGVQQVLQRFLVERQETVNAGVQVTPVMLYNPSVQGRPFTIGAQLGFITYQVTLGVAALGLAREKEVGTLEQLLVTPVTRVELLMGKSLPPAIIGLIDFIALTLITTQVFQIQIRGSFWFLLMGSLLFIFVEIVWGNMLSSVAKTQQQAILLIFIQAMVDVALSGYLVPVRDMPGIFRFLAQFVPLNYYLVFVRSVVLKGAGWAEMWPQLGALAGLGVGIALLATFAISRNLE